MESSRLPTENAWDPLSTWKKSSHGEKNIDVAEQNFTMHRQQKYKYPSKRYDKLDLNRFILLGCFLLKYVQARCC